MLLVQSTSTNIALLFLYAISLRFMSFYYFQDWWKSLVSILYQKVVSSTKKSNKTDSGLIVVRLEVPQSKFWKGVYVVFDKLVKCSFCQGCWSGYLVYLFLVIDFTNLTLNIQQVVEFAFFSWSCGIISRLTATKIDNL
jgi:hypothetical protein